MQVKNLIVALLGIPPETDVFIHLPDKEDDFKISDVDVEDETDTKESFVRLSYAG